MKSAPNHRLFAQSLLASSKELCGRALDAFAAADYRSFYLSAGIALEHAAKAALATTHPVLIADGKNFESMLALAHAPVDVTPIAASLRTVALREAVDRAMRVVPSLRVMRDDLYRLANHRNAVAHLGAVEASAAGQDITPFLTALISLLDHLKEEADAYFGEFATFVRTQLSDQAEETSKEVAGLLAAAQRKFSERYPEGALGYNFAEALHGRDWDAGDEYQPHECPACGTEAVVAGEPTLEVDVDWDVHEGTPIGASYYIEFHPESFNCRACGLDLRATQLAAAGIPPRWPLDDADIEDYMDHEDSEY